MSAAAIAYLGPEGTFTQEAALAYVRRALDRQRQGEVSEPTLIPLPSIPDVLHEVAGGHAGSGVVPLENAIEGSVVLTLDLLIHEVDLKIRGEIVIPVRHNLMARPGLRLADIRSVISHPQALAQCRRRLRELLPGVPTQPALSTAEAARQAAAQEGAAAIGTALAARLYGLNILVPDVQDVSENATRFCVVGRELAERSGYDKTSIVFAFPEDRPGQLCDALSEFASRGVNLTKLESRPARRTLGEYLFIADCEGYWTDPPLAAALAAVRAKSGFFKVLGSYPRARYGPRNGCA
ncbi:MAG TPA: prephenate dehydratase [Limnochordia bacterium]